MTPSLKEPLHPGTGLTLWHKAPVSVQVLVVFPCVRGGGNFLVLPEAAVEGYGQPSAVLAQGSCSPSPLPPPCWRTNLGTLPPSPESPQDTGLCCTPSASQLGAKECSLLPPEPVMQHALEASVSQEVTILQVS